MSAKSEWDTWSVTLEPPRLPESGTPNHRLNAVENVTSADRERPAEPDKSRIHFHPQYQLWLQKQGIRSASDVLKLRGEIVSGHADRHVVRIELTAGTRSRVVYLKREHVVGYRARWRNWRAGFGFVSRCEREAKMLQQLETRGLPAPQWLAYGCDEYGRGFLLVDELYGYVDLRALLSDNVLSLEDRREVITHLARAIAELHSDGFPTPDLCAKHLLISRQTFAATLIDWQSAPANGTLTHQQIIASLANLHASLADQIATPQERIRFLIQYFRRLQQVPSTEDIQQLKSVMQQILLGSEKATQRTSIQLQRRITNEEQPQHLVWLADEAVVVIPELVECWPTPAIAAPYYPADPERERIELTNGISGELIRFATCSPINRIISTLRERPWRSPAANAARMLFHLQQHSISAPRLLAFGQRCISYFREESFILSEPLRGIPLDQYAPHTVKQRNHAIVSGVKMLKQLHEAGCRPCVKASKRDPIFVIDETTSEIKIGSALAIRKWKKITFAQIHSDIQWLCQQLNLESRREKMRVSNEYFCTK